MENKKIRVCFIGYGAYPIFNPESKTIFGGAEVQLASLAKELVKNENFDVSFIVNEKNNKEVENINGVIICNISNFPFKYSFEEGSEGENKANTISNKDLVKIMINKPKKPFKRIRKLLKKVKSIRELYGFLLPIILTIYNKTFGLFFYISRIFKIIKYVDADIYVQRCSSWITGAISLFCKLNKSKKFVFMTAHEVDCDFKCIKHLDVFQKIFYAWGLKNADLVITQNNNHQKLLKDNFKVDSIVKKTAYKINKKSNLPGKFILWVSRLEKWKQPKIFVKLANKFPKEKFVMISPKGKSYSYNKKTIKLASSTSNLKYIPHIAFKDIDSYFRKAKFFVNTSSYEGFPNTFVQSWKSGIPVISLNVDPDKIICKHKLGFHSKNFDKLINDTKSLLTNKKIYKSFSKNSYKYAVTNHDINKIIKSYVKLFKTLMEGVK